MLMFSVLLLLVSLTSVIADKSGNSERTLIAETRSDTFDTETYRQRKEVSQEADGAALNRRASAPLRCKQPEVVDKFFMGIQGFIDGTKRCVEDKMSDLRTRLDQESAKDQCISNANLEILPALSKANLEISQAISALQNGMDQIKDNMTQANRVCSPGYHMFHEIGWCVRANSTTHTMMHAQELCNSIGGRLAVVNSEEKFNLLSRYLQGLAEKPYWWIGGFLDETQNIWKWTTGEIIDFNLSWARLNRDHPGSKCLLIFSGVSNERPMFDDNPCDLDWYGLGYVCEELKNSF